MAIRNFILFSFVIFFKILNFVCSFQIYVGENESEQTGTLAQPYHDIAYALSQTMDNYDDLEILLNQNSIGFNFSGVYAFRSLCNFSIKFNNIRYYI